MFRINNEDYLAIITEENKEILHIEYDADMEDIIKSVYELVKNLNKKED